MFKVVLHVGLHRRLINFTQHFAFYLFSDIYECLSSPCQNGGVCEDLIDEYYCACAEGWEGVNCETSKFTISECELATKTILCQFTLYDPGEGTYKASPPSICFYKFNFIATLFCARGFSQKTVLQRVVFCF